MVGFGQGAFTVVAPVADSKVDALRDLLTTIRDKVREESVPLGKGEPPGPADPRLLTFNGVDDLHFASLAIIPLGTRRALMFEGNIDGEPGVFLDRLAQTQPAAVAKVFGLCEGFNPAQAGEYLKRHDNGTHTFYVGCPGRTLGQIREERTIRETLERALDEKPGEDPRPSLKGVAPYERPFFVRHGKTIYRTGLYGIFVVLALVFLALWLAASLKAALIFLALLVVVVGGTILNLRWVEKADVPWENLVYKPSVDECLQYEDLGIGNHFTSVTDIKPGPFRQGLLRYVLWLVNTEGLLLENKGSLSNIPSIHFARWTILEGRYLLFLSNFDGSWESYLNDFIDKGHEGLTSVWSNTVGFPRTRLLRYEGATHEREFKVYARNSQAPTLVWYRAYPDLTTKNIENNTRIREGLNGSMTQDEEARWRLRL